MDALLKLLPNKKILLAILFAIIILLVSSYASREPKPKTVKENESEEKNGKLVTIDLQTLVQKDSDGDGVRDWEESLWGTDPDNPDTYGRGLGDFAEIENKKAELKKTGPGQSGGQITETDQFALQLFSSITALKQAGSFTEDTVSSLSSSIADNLDNQSAVKTYYALSDLKVTAETASSIEKYREETIRIAEKYGNLGLGGESAIIANAMDKKDPKLLKNLDKNISAYKQLLEETLLTPVPKNLAGNHLAIVNAYRNIVESLSRAEKVFSDPIIGLIQVSVYRNATDLLLFSLHRVELYFVNRDTISETTTPK